MSNRLDPDKARRFCQASSGPNCLERLSADDETLYTPKVLNFLNKNLVVDDPIKIANKKSLVGEWTLLFLVWIALALAQRFLMFKISHELAGGLEPNLYKYEFGA